VWGGSRVARGDQPNSSSKVFDVKPEQVENVGRRTKKKYEIFRYVEIEPGTQSNYIFRSRMGTEVFPRAGAAGALVSPDMFSWVE